MDLHSGVWGVTCMLVDVAKVGNEKCWKPRGFLIRCEQRI